MKTAKILFTLVQKKYCALLVPLFLICYYNSFSQSDTASINTLSLEDLMNIKITTASKKAEQSQKAAGIVSIITSKEIEAYGAKSLFEVLDRATGVFMTGSFAVPNEVVSLRGDNSPHYNTKVLILLNGRPYRESFVNGHNSSIYNALPLESIERLEIIRGPGSVLYGTCAYTGVINVITKSIEKNSAYSTIRYGSYNTRQVTTGGTLDLGELKLRGDFNFIVDDGWKFSGRGESDMTRNKANTADSAINDPRTINWDLKAMSASINAVYKNFRLTSNFASDDQRGVDFSNSWKIVNGSLKDWNFLNERGIVDLGYNFSFSENWSATANATYNYSYWSPHYRNNSNPFGTGFSNDVLVEFTNFIKISPQLDVTVGALINKQTGEGRSFQYYESTTNSFNIYGSVTNDNPYRYVYDQTWWTAYGQLTYNPSPSIKIVAGSQVNKVTDLKLNFAPRLGAIISLNKNLTAKLLYGEAFRSSAGFERNVRLSAVYGNPALGPETIQTSEVQLIYTKRQYELSATYYYSVEHDLIDRSLPSDSLVVENGTKKAIPVYINKGSRTFQGIETEGKININEKFSISGSLVFQWNEDYLGRKNYTGMPSSIHKIGVSYSSPKGLRVGLFNSFFGNFGNTQPKYASLNESTHDVNYLSGQVSVNIPKLLNSSSSRDVIVGLYATNLLDESVNYPEYIRRIGNAFQGRAGRSFYVNLTVRF